MNRTKVVHAESSKVENKESSNIQRKSSISIQRNVLPNFSMANTTTQSQTVQDGSYTQSVSLPSAHDSPQSFQTQEDMDMNRPEASRRTLSFDVNGDDTDDEHDLNNDSDDDNSSYSSATSSSDDDDDENIPGMTLMEKRRRNEERNALRHKELFGDFQIERNNKSKRKTGQDVRDDDDNDTKPRTRGMLMKRKAERLVEPKSFRQRVVELENRYPYRESQIRQLLSMCQSTIGQASNGMNKPKQASGFVPSPIFVIGSSGSGKTDVVRDVLQLARESPPQPTSPPSHRTTNTSTSTVPRSEVAYINCATLEPGTVGRLTVAISQQLRPQSRNTKPSGTKQRMRNQNHSTGKAGLPATSIATLNDVKEDKLGASNIHANDKQQTSQDAETLDEKLSSRQSLHPQQQHQSSNDQMRRVQPVRAAKLAEHGDVSHLNGRGKKRSKDFDNDDDDETRGNIHRSDNAHSAVMALGRRLRPYYRGRSKRCGFVILDQGPERLLTMSSSEGRQERSNVLSELLLLPG